MGSDPTFPTLFIALDWGTTSLRAYRLAENGAVLEERGGGRGIMQVENGDFAAALRDCCGDWLAAHPQARVIASGMIGSKQGWREAPYCPCPANAAALAAHIVHCDIGAGRMMHIVPGVSCIDPASGAPDVMRGEETQIIGAVPEQGSHLVVLPGTHSKWAWVEDGAIRRFSSWMTGEVYAALTQHTILGRLMTLDAQHDAGAFERGVRYGHSRPEKLLNSVFSARTLGLFNQLDASALPSYLSGLLIGAEIGAATRGLGSPPVLLLGSAQLVERYRAACTVAGIQAAPGPVDAAARGLHRLAKAI